MSEKTESEIVPGPVDLDNLPPEPAKKKRAATTRKKAASPTSRKKKDPEKDSADGASEVDNTEKKTESAKTKPSTKASETEQKEWVFSTDGESTKGAVPEEEKSGGSPASEGRESSASGSASVATGGDSKHTDSSESSSGAASTHDKDNSKEGGQPPRKSFQPNKNRHPGQQGKGGFNKNQQQALSNRKKKQQQWKNKQQQKQVRKERFKIDGLKADLDNALELGRLADWEVLSNSDQLTAHLATLPSLEDGKILLFNELYELSLDALRERAHATGQDLPPAPSRNQLIHHVLKYAHESGFSIHLRGNLEILGDGNGMLNYSCDSYRLRALSAFVPALFIKKFGLQRGHELFCRVLPPAEDASCPFVVELFEVQGMDPDKINEVVPFTEQVPYYPLERIFLESPKQEDANKVSMRVVDLISPIGFGQRGLIVAPPRTGKTVLLQGMANAIQTNYSEAKLIILLIDERPEEVTDFKRRVKGGEVISSTFDENAESHVHAAEMVIEKSRRMVEAGENVVILLDSITRLARAYNTVMPNSGKILSGGVEANALQKPKRFFGSARNIEGGGSLTIIATALVETGSKMDEVIFEEFKGTGNMELHLDRALVDKRVFPSLSMEKSGTRKEELLYHPDELNKIYGLRRAMKGVPSTDAMEMLIMKVKKTGSNAEFLMTAAR